MVIFRFEFKPFWDMLFFKNKNKNVYVKLKENKRRIDCWNFLYALYSKRTKEQIANLLFRLTIPSIANRVKELVLFFPKDKKKLSKNSWFMRELFQKRSELNEQLRAIFNQIDPKLVREFPNRIKETFNEWVESKSKLC